MFSTGYFFKKRATELRLSLRHGFEPQSTEELQSKRGSPNWTPVLTVQAVRRFAGGAYAPGQVCSRAITDCISP